MESPRVVHVSQPFDLARTAAPVWWGRRRWPNVDWHQGCFTWVGVEDGRVVSRLVRQFDSKSLAVMGSALEAGDAGWAERVLSTRAVCPDFGDPVIAELAVIHRGFRPWASGSLFEGAVSAIVGQSISVAAAATTEQRLFAIFHPPVELAGRLLWPAPRPEQLAETRADVIRGCGVTMKRAEALVATGRALAENAIRDVKSGDPDADVEADKLLAISGIGPWTVRSALLWGLAAADAHPTGDVALLRCARRHYAHLSGLKDLDIQSDKWRPARGWAARLLWLDGLGWDDGL